MHILYIVSAYSRSPDEVITPWLNETIRRLRQRDVAVEVLAPSYRGLGDQELDGVRVHRFRYAPARWEDLTHDQTAPDRVRERRAYLGLVPGYVTAGSLAAARLARTGRFDVVHVHWPIPHGVLGLAARRAGRLPLVSTFHGVELTWTARKMPFLMPFLRHLIRTSDAVTANSSHTERLIRQVHERPVVRIPFGSALEAPSADVGREAAPLSRASPATDAPQPSSGPLRLLFVGRLVERKGVRHLLDALARLRERHPVELTVVGEGPLRPELEEQARALGLTDRVRFAGFIPAAELAERFRAADVFVLPAVEDAKGDVEGLGVVLVEALTQGLAVVASRSGGIVDVVRDGRTGLLVRPGDAAALAHALETLASDPALRARLARQGRDHVEREFSWGSITNRLVALYRGLAAAT